MSRSPKFQKKGKPPEAIYHNSARGIIRALKRYDETQESIKINKKMCATAMQSVGMRSFILSMDLEGKERYEISLKRPLARRISTEKLYNLVRSGDITLDEFLSSVYARKDDVIALVGESRTEDLVEVYNKPLDIIVKRRS